MPLISSSFKALTSKFARPRIAVTGPAVGGEIAWQMTRLAVIRAGGIPVRVTENPPPSVNRFDALIIGGGSDIHPSHYGMPELFDDAEDQNYDLERDALEQFLAQAALAKGIPILGICRGAQMLNILLGGELVQSVESHYPDAQVPENFLPIASTQVDRNSKLFSIVKRNTLRINKLHSQAISITGKGLSVVAREDNGIIQAVEDPSANFCLGVQWHPEYLPQLKAHRAIFNALIKAC